MNKALNTLLGLTAPSLIAYLLLLLSQHVLAQQTVYSMQRSSIVRTVEFEGHRYLYIKDTGMLHDPNCKGNH